MSPEVKTGAVLPEAAPPSGATFTPAMAISALRRWWKIALPIGLVMGVTGAIIVYLLFVPMYQAQVWLRVYRNPRWIAFPGNDNPQIFLNNQMEALRSPWVMDNVLARSEIARLPELADAADPREHLKSHSTVAISGNSEFLKFEYKSPNANHAAEIANAIINDYLLFYNSRGRQDDDELVKLLKERKEFHQREIGRLRENVKTLAKIAAVKDPLLPDNDRKEEVSPAMESLASLRKQLTNAIVSREVLEAKIKVFEKQGERLDGTVPEPLLEKVLGDHPQITDMSNQLATARIRLSEIESSAAQGKKSAHYEKKAEEVRRLESSLDQRRESLREPTRRQLLEDLMRRRDEDKSQMIEELENARTIELVLQERLNDEVTSNQQSAGDTLNLEFARGELAQAMDVFNRINHRIEQLETERMAPERVEQVKSATVPVSPIEKNPVKKMAMVGFLLFIAPFGVAVGWEALIRRINGRDEIENTTGLRVIGEIPDFTRIGRGRSQHRQLAPYEESINSLRTHLILSHNARDLQVLSVASAVSGEGKTSVAAKLAVSIARATKLPTLLIDGDLRRPDIHRLFDLPFQPGLGDILADKCSLDDAIVHDAQTGLDILPAGNMHFNPHQSMSGPTMHNLLAEVRRRYRHVVIDTTPVLQASESLNIHAAVDGCLLCTMRDVTRVDRYQLAFRRLMAAGARPIGVVLNGVSWMQYSNRYGGYEYYAEAAADVEAT